MKGRGSQPKNQANPTAPHSRGVFRILSDRAGYTIVEVMVFLAVSAALFAMIVGTFSSRQAGTEFSVATKEMNSQLQDIANDVSTGFYNNPGNFRCMVSGGAPQLVSAGANEQGTNSDCIFIGRVAQFDLAGSDGHQFNLYSVVGARQSSGEDVENFSQARPLAIASSARSNIDLTETQQLPVGLVTHSMYAVGTSSNPTVRYPIRAVGFFSTFGAGAAESSSLSVNIIPIGLAFGGSPVGNDKASVVNAISNLSDTYAATYANPPGGILICMNGDKTDQHAVVKLGGNQQGLSTDVTVEGGTCAQAGY